MNTPTHGFSATHTTPLGPVLLLASQSGLAGLWFEEQRHHPGAERMAAWTPSPDHPLLRDAAAWLDGFFQGHHPPLRLPLDLSAGTAFQQAVWRALLTLAAGRTCSYQQLAQQIGRPKAVRALGAAVGRNPLSIIVPCHRVLGSDGSLTGYAGGIDRKRALLRLEAHCARSMT